MPARDDTAGEEADWGPLSGLPGNPMMWVLIVSEVLVFGAFFLGYTGARVLDPDGFAAAQQTADRVLGGINTIVLVLSGLFAALAVKAADHGRTRAVRGHLGAAMLLGGGFLAVKVVDYADKIAAGHGMEEHSWFMLYYLMTGFHALHVVAGIGILAFVAWQAGREAVETGVAFWHMVDLIWVLIYPIVYLIR